MNQTLECPVDRVMVNENKARAVAFFVLLIAVAYLLTGYLCLVVFLIPDFFLRITPWAKYSPLGLLADTAISAFKIGNKPTDRAPKRFAAGTGLVFTLMITSATLLHFDLVSLILTAILIFFAALESLARFCAGCYVYSILKTFRLLTDK